MKTNSINITYVYSIHSVFVNFIYYDKYFL